MAKFMPYNELIAEIAKYFHIVNSQMSEGKSHEKVIKTDAYNKILINMHLLMAKHVVEKRGLIETIEKMNISKEQEELLQAYKKNG